MHVLTHIIPINVSDKFYLMHGQIYILECVTFWFDWFAGAQESAFRLTSKSRQERPELILRTGTSIIKVDFIRDVIVGGAICENDLCRVVNPSYLFLGSYPHIFMISR